MHQSEAQRRSTIAPSGRAAAILAAVRAASSNASERSTAGRSQQATPNPSCPPRPLESSFCSSLLEFLGKGVHLRICGDLTTGDLENGIGRWVWLRSRVQSSCFHRHTGIASMRPDEMHCTSAIALAVVGRSIPQQQLLHMALTCLVACVKE